MSVLRVKKAVFGIVRCFGIKIIPIIGCFEGLKRCVLGGGNYSFLAEVRVLAKAWCCCTIFVNVSRSLFIYTLCGCVRVCHLYLTIKPYNDKINHKFAAKPSTLPPFQYRPIDYSIIGGGGFSSSLYLYI